MNAAGDPGLQQVLQFGAQMLKAARLSDWERVAGLQAICADRVQQPWAATAQTHDALQLLQEQHLSVLALAAQAHESIGRELGMLHDNHRALSAYLAAGSGN